jgi:GrpB-like predicted nucleotidyltransferase (UPF0157 family)
MSKQANVRTVSVADFAKGKNKKLAGILFRRKLRASGLRKPGTRWEWPVGHRDLKKVRALVKH